MRVEIREDRVLIEGYVNAVGRDSRVIPSPTGGFVEQVEPKTFERALQSGKDVELRLNHERVIGSTGGGNLHLREDNIGLFARAEVTDPETMERARNNELRGWSFGFVKKKDRTEPLENGLHRRFLEDIELREVSILDNRKTPAYVGTSIEVRGQDGETPGELFETRGMEDVLDVFDQRSKEPPQKERAGNQDWELEFLKLKGVPYESID